uniref:Uncharacterized protein n=1 Tax=Arundo donax TaxID=35708 RepID=A0A0A8XXR5_ARUDO
MIPEWRAQERKASFCKPIYLIGLNGPR